MFGINLSSFPLSQTVRLHNICEFKIPYGNLVKFTKTFTSAESHLPTVTLPVLALFCDFIYTGTCNFETMPISHDFACLIPSVM